LHQRIIENSGETYKSHLDEIHSNLLRLKEEAVLFRKIVAGKAVSATADSCVPQGHFENSPAF